MISYSTNNDMRIVRSNALSGQPIPADVTARLMAQGVDVAALEQRVVDMNRFSTQETAH